jgi:hypothetical protein
MMNRFRLWEIDVHPTIFTLVLRSIIIAMNESQPMNYDLWGVRMGYMYSMKAEWIRACWAREQPINSDWIICEHIKLVFNDWGQRIGKSSVIFQFGFRLPKSGPQPGQCDVKLLWPRSQWYFNVSLVFWFGRATIWYDPPSDYQIVNLSKATIRILIGVKWFPLLEWSESIDVSGPEGISRSRHAESKACW